VALILADIPAVASPATTTFVIGLTFPPLALSTLADPDSADLDPTLPYPVLDQVTSVELIGASSPITSPENRVAEYISSRTETLRGVLNLVTRNVNLIPQTFMNRDGESAVDGEGDPLPSYMRGHLDMGLFQVIDLSNATTSTGMVTKEQLEEVQFGAEDDVEQILDTQIIRRDGTIAFGADFDMGTPTPRRIINLGAPTLAAHLETKTNFDTQVTAFENSYLQRTGNTPMLNDLDFRESLSVRHKVINLGAPVAGGDMVNLTYLNAQVALAQPQGVPVGAIIAYAAFFSQIGSQRFLVCNGQEVSRTLYQNLFNIIGTVYGTPSGAGVFKLPDLRGRTPVGLDNMGGTPANRITNPDADVLGRQFGLALQPLDVTQIPAHTHTFLDVISATGAAGAEFGSANENNVNTLASDESTTDPTGGDQGHPNIQPSRAITYFIRY
jgi:microcystin-dependent protein